MTACWLRFIQLATHVRSNGKGFMGPLSRPQDGSTSNSLDSTHAGEMRKDHNRNELNPSEFSDSTGGTWTR